MVSWKLKIELLTKRKALVHTSNNNVLSPHELNN